MDKFEVLVRITIRHIARKQRECAEFWNKGAKGLDKNVHEVYCW